MNIPDYMFKDVITEEQLTEMKGKTFFDKEWKEGDICGAFLFMKPANEQYNAILSVHMLAKGEEVELEERYAYLGKRGKFATFCEAEHVEDFNKFFFDKDEKETE